MEAEEDNINKYIAQALLSQPISSRKESLEATLPRFSESLKENFENKNLWKQFALTLYLIDEPPRRTLQALKECLRIDKHDPVPAMLAAKLLAETLDEQDEALEMANEAIKRCLNLSTRGTIENNGSNDNGDSNKTSHNSTPSSSSEPELNDCADDVDDGGDESATKGDSQRSVTSSGNKKTCNSSKNAGDKKVAKVSYYYSSSLLARCYLIASIISAYSYERIPESIKKYKLPLMETSMHNLELALKTNSTDHLAYFHKALHKANNRLFSEAIDSVRQAIKLNPLYIPSISLLLLSLSALKMHEDALLLCESSLREFKDNLTLLYIKCNLEQYLAATTCGYKSALNTCQHILKCIKQVSHLSAKKRSGVQKSAAALFKEDTSRDVVKCDDNNIACEYRIWLLVAEIFIKMGMVSV